MKLYFLLILSLLVFSNCTAQPTKREVKGTVPVSDTLQLVPYVDVRPADCPKDYFSHPLKCDVSLTGTFAEVRANHFHSGIDLRIGGKVGEPVYAAQEGFVSRINISPWGGGKVLYIDHPNGYRTVYMHLNDFVGEIADFVNDYQYSHETYSFDVTIPAGKLPVDCGQLVAHAGNTGSSGGPHLHYEIRLAATDQTINPLYFGMRYSDPVRPQIRGIRLYPMDGNPISLTSDTVSLAGSFYAGIYATDLSEQGSGKNGVEQIELLVDDTLFFRYNTASFLFEETRSVNAIIDYPHYKSSKEYYIITRHLPALRMANHWVGGSEGIISFADSLPHKLTYIVSDYKGNTDRRTFYVKAFPTVGQSAAKPCVPAISYRVGGVVRNGESRLSLPPMALYADDDIEATCRTDSRFLSKVYSYQPVHNQLPPHVACKLSIAQPSGSQPDKMVIVNLKGSKYSACATTRVDGRLVAKIKEFGEYAVSLDLTAPIVRPVNFKDGKPITGKNSLQIKVTDDLSGLQRYACYLDDNWVLAEYDGKSAALYVSVRLVTKGRHTLRVVATDALGNTTTKEWQVIK